MRVGITAAGALTVLMSAPDFAPAQSFSKLGFMAGCWTGLLTKDKVVEEIWTSPAENLMQASTRTLEKKRATSWEFTTIEKADSTLLFISTVREEPADTFRLKFLVDEAATWERGGTEFPNRIMYRRASDGALIVRLESDIGQPSFELRMLRFKCP